MTALRRSQEKETLFTLRKGKYEETDRAIPFFVKEIGKEMARQRNRREGTAVRGLG